MCMDPRGVVVVEDWPTGLAAARSPGAAALEHVANRPIADHVLEELKSAGVHEVVVACSCSHAPQLRSILASEQTTHGLRLQFVEQPGRIDLSDALRLAAPVVGTAPCIVHLAGGLLAEPLGPLVTRLQDGAPDIVLVVHRQPAVEEHLSPATQDMLRIAALHPERAPLGMAGVWLFGPGALLGVRGTSLGLGRRRGSDGSGRADRRSRRQLSRSAGRCLAQLPRGPARSARAQSDGSGSSRGQSPSQQR